MWSLDELHAVVFDEYYDVGWSSQSEAIEGLNE